MNKIICDRCKTDKDVFKDYRFGTALQHFRYDLCNKCHEIVENRIKEEQVRILQDRDNFKKHLLD